jgi:hypothetical protein
VNEDKATRYQRLKRWASVVSLAWSAGLLLALVLSGWTLALRRLADGVTGVLGGPERSRPSIVVALVVFLAALHGPGSLPIDFYGGFALERRFGLATERFGRWLRDRRQSLAPRPRAGCPRRGVHLRGAAGPACVVVGCRGVAFSSLPSR